MRKQQIFDITLNHLRKQGRAAKATRDGATVCAYRGRNGRMCAVGVHIPDELYDKTIEGVGIFYIQRPDRLMTEPDRKLADILRKIGFRENQLELLSDLQSAHDCILDDKGIEEWEQEMQAIAKIYNLKYTPAAESSSNSTRKD